MTKGNIGKKAAGIRWVVLLFSVLAYSPAKATRTSTITPSAALSFTDGRHPYPEASAIHKQSANTLAIGNNRKPGKSITAYPDKSAMDPDTVPVGHSQGEMLPMQILEQVEVHRRTLTAEERNAYLRMVYNVRRTYPYAVLAKERMEEYTAIRDSLHAAGRKKESRKYLKEQEQQIRDDFLEDLKNMTKSQGTILIKLLARQTDTTAYYLLKDFRGGARAFAYQTMAVFWGYDLKAGYDPEGEDWDIESVVRLIEQKRLSTIAPRMTPALDKKTKKNKKKAAKARTSSATAPATLPPNSYGGLHTPNRN